MAKQHQLIVGILRLEARKRKAMRAKPRIKWWKLREEEFRKKYREAVRQKLDWDSENTWEMVAEVLRETALKVLGMSTGSKKEGKETWCGTRKYRRRFYRRRKHERSGTRGKMSGVSSSIWRQRKRLRGQ